MADPLTVATSQNTIEQDEQMNAIVNKALKKRKRKPTTKPGATVMKTGYDSLEKLSEHVPKVIHGCSYGAEAGGFKPSVRTDDENGWYDKHAIDAWPGIGKSAKRSGKDLGLDMESTSGSLADYFTPGTWGGSRAGRATQLGNMMDDEDTKPDFNVRHPLTSTALGGLAGGLGGAALGGITGGTIGGIGWNEQGAIDGLTIGGAGGAALGGIAIPLLLARLRRASMDNIVKNYEAGDPVDKTKAPTRGWASSLLLPMGGAHHAGQADVYEAINRDEPVRGSTGRNIGYVASHTPYLGAAVAPVRGLQQGINSKLRVSDVDNERKRNKKREAREKDKAEDTNPNEDNMNNKAAYDMWPGVRPIMYKRAADPLAAVGNALKGVGSAATGALGSIGGPAALGGLAGAGLGGIYGGLLNPDEDENGDKNRMLSALKYALLGGGIGGLGGAGYGLLSGNKAEPSELDALRAEKGFSDPQAPVAPPTPSAPPSARDGGPADMPEFGAPGGGIVRAPSTAQPSTAGSTSADYPQIPTTG